MKNLILIFLSTSIFAAFSYAIEVDCEYYDSSFFWAFPRIAYYCLVQSIHITTPNVKIEKFNGQHRDGINNSNVELIFVYDPPNVVNYFPKNIENLFPNLKYIRFNLVELKEIHQSDLEPFPELEVLNLDYNKIEYLEKDLLKFNTNLRGFSARGNPITFIHPTVFDHLSGLNNLDMVEISCVTELDRVDNNRAEVLKIISRIKSGCSNGLKKLTDLIDFTENPQKTCKKIEQLKDKIEQLKYKIEQLEGKTEQLNEKIEQLEGKTEQLVDKTEQLEEKINQISTQLSNLAQKLIDQLDKITTEIQVLKAENCD